MTSQSSEAEILVHVAAASRAADDAVYRQLAQAYLDFEPHTRQSLPLTEKTRQQVPPSQEWENEKEEEEFVAANLPPGSFAINSQNLSFEGVLDNRSSPRLRVDHHRVAAADDFHLHYSHSQGASQDQESHVVESQTSWRTPPSQISDSYPLPDAGLLLQTSPSRVLQRYIGSSLKSTHPPASSVVASQQTSDEPRDTGLPSSLPPLHQQEEEEEEPANANPTLPSSSYHAESGKIIPVTPYTSKKSGLLKRKHQLSEDVVGGSPARRDTFIDLTHISNTDLSVSISESPSLRVGSEPLPSSIPSQARSNRPPSRSSPDFVRSSSDFVRNPALEQVSRSLEILSPPPPAGLADIDPDDLVSDKMAKLARDLSSRYRPTVSREMAPFERGYWLVDCSSWSAQTRADTWVFLNNYLRSGLAGWGTWCRRNESHSWIRLYCWGHGTKHAYLLLYLASGRQLKTTGAGWFGADGQLAIEVPPYHK